MPRKLQTAVVSAPFSRLRCDGSPKRASAVILQKKNMIIKKARRKKSAALCDLSEYLAI